MKTLYILLLPVFAVIQGQAQDRSRHERLSDGLEMIGGSRHDYSQYQNLSRFNYWSSRFDRYWSKYEKVFNKDFAERITRSTRNLSSLSNDWGGDRYSTRNKQDAKRKEGLIKIN